MGKSKISAAKAGKYVKRPGEMCGEIRLVKDWDGMGQEVSNKLIEQALTEMYEQHDGEVVPSPETFKTGGAFARTSQLYRDLGLLSKRVNEMMKRADPTFFQALSELHWQATAKHTSMAAWTSVDPLLFEGRELLFNRIPELLRDHLDPKLAYAGQQKHWLRELRVRGNDTSQQ